MHLLIPFFPLLFLFSQITLRADSPSVDPSMYGLLYGRYILIGKEVHSERTYHGTMLLTEAWEPQKPPVKVTRTIGGKTSFGYAEIRELASGGHSLHITFIEGEREYGIQCLWQLEPDIYSRISGYLYQMPGEASDLLALEVFFYDHFTKDPRP